ncbi:Cobyric acid synthase [hydrothermal vent metagenome]|uniref:threonine-phosphate decarboxylase n=1 Tax=hydrothermal vent metagenome TaxID=652676 RepID=A0A3B1CQP9_9ZZZZ
MQKHGGNIKEHARVSGLPEDEITDFSLNMNPLGQPSWLKPMAGSVVSLLSEYPDPDCESFVKAISKAHGVAENEVVAGAGATELLHVIPRALDFKKAVVVAPAYTDYENALTLAGVHVDHFCTTEAEDFNVNLQKLGGKLKGGEAVFIGRPNNPTGVLVDASALRNLATEFPNTTFIIDESFGGFVENFDSLINNRPENVIVVVSMTKLYAMAGVRLGFLVTGQTITAKIKRHILPWSVSSLAQVVGAKTFEANDFACRMATQVKKWRCELREALGDIPAIKVFDSSANFLLVKITQSVPNANQLYKRALKDGIAIRVCDDFEGLDDSYFRIAVKTPDENKKLVEVLKNALSGMPPKTRFTVARKPALMIQGTCSNAGKSVITAAFCRIMKNDGINVAPFKAQNMSLNSYVTLDGKEIGRAQATQAQACGKEPDVRMNPVLIKPSADTMAQIIVRGEPVSQMDVKEYILRKKDLFPVVKEDYDSLASEHDAIVLEGAGSPAEINLKRHDIVNMRMAKHANAKTLIVGDIDKGGVFASFIGTIDTLEQWERKLVAGFIINKFRGDASLLTDAFDYTRCRTGKPVFGNIPYIHNLGLPEEDVAYALGSGRSNDVTGCVDIVLVSLRHPSNTTDFDPLYMEPDVTIRVARNPEDFGTPNLVIIPGSKNTVADLEHLRQNGMAQKIAELFKIGDTQILGVCGGLQMLGEQIYDPHGVESGKKDVSGLGFLPITTQIMENKTLKRVRATHKKSLLSIEGYEIHHGISAVDGVETALESNGDAIGFASRDGRVWGTYLHGLFDDDIFRRWFIDDLRKQKGLEPKNDLQVVYDVDGALDRLANVVRESVDMNAIYGLLKIK